MDVHHTTTPFGRRRLSLAMVASQATAKACPPEAAVHKWQVFRAICEGRHAIGASERSLAVLNALLTFHPETVLSGKDDLVVFPSNLQLALRAHGMAPATLRRHLALLVDCGLLLRRDSPNGKRYARKGQGGAVEQAFGFDLHPLVARAAEFERHAEAVRAERRSLLLVRERITLLRRDISKMTATAIEEGIPGDWCHVLHVYRTIVGRIPRTAPSADLEPIAQDLQLLADEVRMMLEMHVKEIIQTSNESQNERHKQNSKTNTSFESEPDFQRKPGSEIETRSENPRPPSRTFPLTLVLEACPDISDYATDGISSWRDLVATAAFVRSMLGISPSAWEDAQRVFGAQDAAVIVAAILQRAEAIKSAGGYIRDLTEKAEGGRFSIGPMIMALLRQRTGVSKRA